MTDAQRRLIEEIKRQGGDDEEGAEFWPVVNDWVRDAGPTRSLALRNINQTVEALLRRGIITIDDGCFRLVTR